MKRTYLAAYGLLALCLFVPLGIRWLTWPTPPQGSVDPAMAEVGRSLFMHDWTPNDPLCAGGDGLGPVYNATSCVACHKQGGVGGSDGLEHNVTVFVKPLPLQKPQVGVVHAHAVKFQETLQHVDPRLPAESQPSLETIRNLSRMGRQGRGLSLVDLSQRNTPALFGAGLIDAIPESTIIAEERAQWLRHGGAPADGEDRPAGRALRLADGRIGRFGWKAQSASLSDFVRAACAGELGLGNPGRDQPAPLGQPDHRPPGLDLTALQCDQMTAFIAALPQPVERVRADAGTRREVREGKHHFQAIGCADCHVPQLGSVAGLYSDLLLHRMGRELEGSGSYNQALPGRPDRSDGDTLPDEWRTPPLWGVADSGPWMHDGRASTLKEAIVMHAGQAARAAGRFSALPAMAQVDLIAFLESLRAP